MEQDGDHEGDEEVDGFGQDSREAGGFYRGF